MSNQQDKELKEIETKERAILGIKKLTDGLTKEEENMFQKLEKKYRDKRGHLIKGSFFINSESKWVKVK